MKISLVLSLILALSTLTTAIAVAQTPPAFNLLAFACVPLDPTQPAVVQFERESFPPSTDTGLFVPDGPQLLYVEGGRLTIFSEQDGQMLAGAGDWFPAPSDSALGVRNDDFADASLLWLRLAAPFDVAQSSQFAGPQVIDILRASARLDVQGPQPIFAEIELPDVSLARGYLFMAQLDFDPLAVDPSESGLAAITTGAAAVVVETGELMVNDPAPQRVLAGQATLVDKDAYRIENSSGEPARAYLIGIVAEEDKGQVRAAMARAQDGQQACSS